MTPALDKKIPGTLRFLTLNLWGENGPWQARIELLLERLGPLAPDIIGLQEVREVPGRVPNHAAEIASRCGFHHVFAPSSAWGGGREGLAIVSRFPISAHEVEALPHSIETEGRIILSAHIDAPAPMAPFWIHTTHLSYREAEGRKREDQVLFVDAVLTAHGSDNVQIVMGDFNAVPDSDEIRFLTGMTSLDGRRVAYQDAWARANVVGSGGTELEGVTWASRNPYITWMHWLRPDRRLDYIFVSGVRRDRRAMIHGASVVFDQPGAPTAAGEPVFVSDHFGVVADVQMVGEPPHAAP